MHSRVVIAGGYGAFGQRVAKSLAAHAGVEVVIAGRDAARADAVCAQLGSAANPLVVDCTDPRGIAAMLALRPQLVIDAAGPFQGRSYALAEACARNGAHYVDLADARAHVAGITQLDAIARANNVLIASGASTVPAITTALVDALAPERASVRAIEVGISPGHRAPRGLATVRSILAYCGKRVPSTGAESVAYGWGDLGRHHYPAPVGSRWLSTVDVPERELWLARYPGLHELRVRAGLEVSVLHWGLSFMARLVRLGWIESLEPLARFAVWAAEHCDPLGSASGAMFVMVRAAAADGTLMTRTAYWIAELGHGPEIPAAPSALLAKRLLGLPGYRPVAERGAMPCVGLLTVEELRRELAPFAIRFLERN